MKKNFFDRLNIALIYLAVISLIRFKLDINLLFLWAGGLAGAVILYSDYLFQVLLVQPQLEISSEVKKLMEEKKYKQVLILVYTNTGKITSLTFHSVLFQTVFTAFAFFVLTSTNSVFGQSLTLTVLLYLLSAQVLEFMSTGKLKEEWFDRINIHMTVFQQKIYLIVAGAVFVLLSNFIIQ